MRLREVHFRSYNWLFPSNPVPLNNPFIGKINKSITDSTAWCNNAYICNTTGPNTGGPIFQPLGHFGLARLVEVDDVEENILMCGPHDCDGHLNLCRGQRV